jgi:hypothetical protein
MEKINQSIILGGKKISLQKDYLDGFLTIQDGRGKF